MGGGERRRDGRDGVTGLLHFLHEQLRQEECDTNLGLDEERDSTLCEAYLRLCRQKECVTNLGLDEERDSTLLCEAELHL